MTADSQAEVGLHPRPAQVDEPVLQPGHLIDLDPVVDGERRRFGRIEDHHRAVGDLDLAGGQVGIDGSLGTVADHPFHGQDVLAAHVDGARDHALDGAAVITQVDEGEVLAVLPALGHPSAHGDGGTGVHRPQRPAQPGAHGGGLVRCS